MRTSIIVIDDFYDDPHRVREMALRLPYQDKGAESNYPGVNSLEPLYVEGLDETVSRLVQEPVVPSERTAHGGFRLAMEGDDKRARLRVHVDGESYWSGIVYLTLPEHCQGGTEFFRHRELASDHAPLYDEDVARFGERSCAEFTKRIILTQSRNDDIWEHIMTVPMRFNRCILLRPWLWHTAGPSFGDCPENARLIQMFFFTLDKGQLQGNVRASSA